MELSQIWLLLCPSSSELFFFFQLCFLLHLLRNCRLFPLFDEVLDPVLMPSSIAVRKKGHAWARKFFLLSKISYENMFPTKMENIAAFFSFVEAKQTRNMGMFLKCEIIFAGEMWDHVFQTSMEMSQEAEILPRLYNLHLKMDISCGHYCAIRPTYSLVVVFCSWRIWCCFAGEWGITVSQM